MNAINRWIKARKTSKGAGICDKLHIYGGKVKTCVEQILW